MRYYFFELIRLTTSCVCVSVCSQQASKKVSHGSSSSSSSRDSNLGGCVRKRNAGKKNLEEGNHHRLLIRKISTFIQFNFIFRYVLLLHTLLGKTRLNFPHSAFDERKERRKRISWDICILYIHFGTKKRKGRERKKKIVQVFKAINLV